MNGLERCARSVGICAQVRDAAMKCTRHAFSANAGSYWTRHYNSILARRAEFWFTRSFILPGCASRTARANRGGRCSLTSLNGALAANSAGPPKAEKRQFAPHSPTRRTGLGANTHVRVSAIRPHGFTRATGNMRNSRSHGVSAIYAEGGFAQWKVTVPREFASDKAGRRSPVDTIRDWSSVFE